jgi:hypothetical protein
VGIRNTVDSWRELYLSDVVQYYIIRLVIIFTSVNYDSSNECINYSRATSIQRSVGYNESMATTRTTYNPPTSVHCGSVLRMYDAVDLCKFAGSVWHNEHRVGMVCDGNGGYEFYGDVERRDKLYYILFVSNILLAGVLEQSLEGAVYAEVTYVM